MAKLSVQEIIDALKELSVLELNDLVTRLLKRNLVFPLLPVLWLLLQVRLLPLRKRRPSSTLS